MNINNIEEASFIKRRIKSNKIALDQINAWLEKYPNGNSDGTSSFGDEKLFSLHFQEFKDGSGKNSVVLSGSLIQTEILEMTRSLLRAKIQGDLNLIESL